MDTILNFGKYKGQFLEDVFDIDRSYIEWIYKNHNSEVLKEECYELLYPKSIGKVEDIVRNALQHRGFSQTEANIFIKKLKGIK